MKSILVFTVGLALLICSGCGESNSTGENLPSGEATGQQFLVDAEPANAIPVGAARTAASDGDRIALVGHIGGSAKPFVDGLAAFTIVDPKVNYCPPEEGCPTPWDYCCTQDEVKINIATVKVVDPSGQVIAQDAKQLLGVKELSLVVAEGIAKRDEQGNLSLLAKSIFVKN